MNELGESGNDINSEEHNLSHYLLVRLNDDKYFIYLPLIERIIKPLEIFPIPDTLPFIAGVSNFSGEIIPMVDLKKALKLPDIKQAKEKKFIICRHHDIKVGFILDDVIDSWEIDEELFKGDTTRVIENEYILAEYIHTKDVIAVVDIKKFIDNHKAA